MTTHFNPWRGCTKISPGCANCYADAMSKRNPKTLGVWGPKGTRVVAAENYWKEPLKWNRWANEGICWHCWGESTKPTPGRCEVCDGKGTIDPYRARVFCASLADVFEEWDGPMHNHKGDRLMVDGLGAWRTEGENVTSRDWRLLTMDDVRRRLFELIEATPCLDWLLLTKRPENIRRMWPLSVWRITSGANVDFPFRKNVWLGTSVSNQATYDKQNPELAACRDLCPVTFLSIEPQLGPITLDPNRPIDWVICGGESGPGARPFNLTWARSLRDQCKAAGVPFFFKQAGSNIQIPNDKVSDWSDACPYIAIFGHEVQVQGELLQVKLRDKKGGDILEFPKDLRVRQFPITEAP